jgi:acetyltransferase
MVLPHIVQEAVAVTDERSRHDEDGLHRTWYATLAWPRKSQLRAACAWHASCISAFATPVWRIMLSSPAIASQRSTRLVGEDTQAPPASGYPKQVRLRDGTHVVIRPIGPEDAEREQGFVRGLSPESRYFRFMNTLRELSPEMLNRFTHPNPAREIALVALTNEPGESRQIGVARCVTDPNRDSAEFAVVVADAFQGRGLGSLLMRELIDRARNAGLRQIEGLVLATNHRMLELMSSLGFEIETMTDDPRMRRVWRQLH